MEWVEVFVILECSLPFYPPNNPKNQYFEKMKKTPRDIIILQMCTLNDNHMMYGTWDTEPLDRIFCHFGPFFALQSTQQPEKSTSWKNEKPPGDIITLHMCTINDNHMMYGSWNMECVMHRILCHFGPFFVLLTLKQSKKSKFWKNEKKTWRHYHFTQVYHKWQSYDVWFVRYWARQTECFVISDHFLPLYPPNKPKNKNLKKWKKHLEILSFYTSVP